MRTLSQVKNDMLNIGSFDKESDHIEADELLVETIRLLYEDMNITKLRKKQLCEQIIKAYEKIDKWHG